MARKYEQRERAAGAEETRRRIAAATAELHATVGPARTTISAIAERAGVQRLTVYRHFPSDRELFAACSAHWLAGSPPPDPAPWTEIADPDERLATALRAIYRWYRANEGMIANTERDAPLLPALAEIADPASYLEPVRELLLAGREGGALQRAAIGHALAFSTWRSLTRGEALDEDAAAGLMVALAATARR
jgi:AcrR family transcriptional regulator